MILILSVSSLVTALGLTYLLPEKYRANSVVLVRPQEKIHVSESAAGKEILDFPVTQLAPIDAPSKTYIEVIQSRAVVEQIVHALSLDTRKRVPKENYYLELLAQMKEKAIDYVEWAIHILKYGREVVEDPLSKAVDKVQKNLSLKATKDTYIFEISNEANDPNDAAAVANKAAEIFTDYMAAANSKEASGVRAFSENRLVESERELANARQLLREFKGGNDTFSLAEEYSEKLKRVNELQKDLEKAESQLAGLLKTYTRSHPKVVRLLAEKDHLIQALARLKNELKVSSGKEQKLETLKLRIKVLEGNYELANKTYEVARIEDARHFSEIRIVSSAVPPTFPAKPIRYYYAGGGFFFALMVGITLAIFLETQRARIRSIEDVAAVLKLPVLSAIPLM